MKKKFRLTKIKETQMKATIIYYFLLKDFLRLKQKAMPQIGEGANVLSQTTGSSVIWYILSGNIYQKL